MNTHCRYCTREFASLGLPPSPKRVQCGNDACKDAYIREWNKRQKGLDGPPEVVYANPARDKHKAAGSFDNIARVWGEVTVPDRQAPLTKAMNGQVIHCPGCGSEHPVPSEQLFTCTKCRSVWTISWGTKPNGDVVVARMDRWR